MQHVYKWKCEKTADNRVLWWKGFLGDVLGSVFLKDRQLFCLFLPRHLTLKELGFQQNNLQRCKGQLTGREEPLASYVMNVTGHNFLQMSFSFNIKKHSLTVIIIKHSERFSWEYVESALVQGVSCPRWHGDCWLFTVSQQQLLALFSSSFSTFLPNALLLMSKPTNSSHLHQSEVQGTAVTS